MTTLTTAHRVTMISRQLAQQVNVGQPMFNMSRVRSRQYMSKATRQTGLITAVFNPFQYRTIIIRINYLFTCSKRMSDCFTDIM